MSKYLTVNFVNGKSQSLVLDDNEYRKIIDWMTIENDQKLYEVIQNDFTYIINKNNICLVTVASSH